MRPLDPGYVATAIFAVGTMIALSSASFAQSRPPVKTTENLEYYPCSSKLPKSGIDRFHLAISMLVKSYNNQDDLDVKMPEPKRQHCYVAQERGGRDLRLKVVSFYTSQDHFECATEGNCSGPLRGYRADMEAVDESLQLTINTNKVNNQRVFCMEPGRDLRPGVC